MTALEALAKENVELKNQLQKERLRIKNLIQENAHRKGRMDDLEEGRWYVGFDGELEGPYRTKEAAQEYAEEYAQEGMGTAFTIHVVERHEAPLIEDMDAYNGVRRGVDYPATM